MLKGFFLDWIHIDDARVGIGDGVELPLNVNPSSTSSSFVGNYDTFVWASAALHYAVSKCFIEISFLNVGVCCGKPLFRPCQIHREQHGTTCRTKSGSDEISA